MLGLKMFAFLHYSGRSHGFRIALEISSSRATSSWVFDQICQHHVFQLRTLTHVLQYGSQYTNLYKVSRNLTEMLPLP